MKSVIVLLLSAMSASSLVSVSAFASETKYNCVAKYLAKYRADDLDPDTQDNVENIQVTLDGDTSHAVFPLSKKRVEITFFTTQPEEDGSPGQYALNAILHKDADSKSLKESYETTMYFMGLNQEIAILLQMPAPGAKKSAFAVHCKLK